MAKKNKRNDSYLSIRKKLIAAVAMLLVASFMVASSSYAWFTLSTAPEVTGIQTTVGANGSLEIALIGTDDTMPGESQVGDGAEEKTINEKNITWGNIVDLADDGYGLQTIILKPARLVVDANGTDNTVSLNSSILSVPEYGADGRITVLNSENTVTGIYNNGAFKVGGAGVRAVGTTSDMTLQQLMFDSAKSTAIVNIRSAKSTAATSLNTNGPKLAKVLTAKATDTGSTTYDLSCVAVILDDLDKANDAIEKAIRAYLTACVAKDMEDETETTFQAAIATLNSKDTDTLVGEWVTAFGDETAAKQTTLYKAYELWDANKDAIDEAQSEYDSIGTDGKAAANAITWDSSTPSVKSILIDSGLVDIGGATLNNFSAGEIKANMSAMMSSYLKDGLTIKFGDNGGVYSNIAKVAGNYDTTITFEEGTSVSLDSGAPIDLKGMVANMKVETTGDPYDVSSNSAQTDVQATWTAAPEKPEVEEGQEQEANIADAYAYMVDLAFRTNAAGSSLKLQTAATGRIYGNNGGTEETMGGGATMTFQSQDTMRFSADQVKSLMKAVRIVFVDAENTIIAMGALDTDNAVAAGQDITAEIKLVDYSIVTAEDDTNGMVTINTTTDESTGATTISWKEDASIMDLQQNIPTRLSVLVYLDGDKVTNADVATGDYSVRGTLNLQFSSSAELKPMEYANLMNPDGTVSGGEEEEENPAASTNIELANTGLTAGANVAQAMTTAQTLVLPEKSATDKDITWTVTTDESNVGNLDSNNLTADGAGTVVLGYSYAAEAEGDPAVTGTVTVTVTAAAAGGEGS